MTLSPLTKRICTSLVLIPIVIAVLFFASLLFFKVLVSIFFLLAVWEWTSLMSITAKSQKIFYLLLFSTIFALANHSVTFLTITIAVMWWVLATIWVFYYARTTHTLNLGVVVYGLIGILTLFPCWLGLNEIRALPHGPYLILYILVLIWAVDSGAYFTGKKFGRRKLMPTVSPGKTWAGVYGGILAGLLVAIFTIYLFHFDFVHGIRWLVWSFLTILISMVGDLFISVMKRQRNIKDSGNLLPGHGGILDRIDSLTAAVPLFTLGLLYFGIY